MNKLILRKAKPQDLDSMLKIEQESFGIDAFNKSQIRYLVNRANSECLVCEIENKIVASMILLRRKNSSVLRLYSLVVSPGYRGLGIARVLLDNATKIAIDNNMNAIVLEVRIDNIPAIKLYEKNGYSKIKILPNYYKDGSNGLRMQLHNLRNFDS